MKKNTEIIQFRKPYQSTIQFFEFLERNNFFSKPIINILDLGCGIGANINFFQKNLITLTLQVGIIQNHKYLKQENLTNLKKINST
jgi:hypothetical protein